MNDFVKTMQRLAAAVTSVLLLTSSVLAEDAPVKAPRAEATTDATSWSSGPYEYDGAGNIKRVGDDFYRYDAHGRLVSAEVKTPTSPVNRQVFTYDRYGNLLTVTTTTGTTTATATDVAAYAVRTSTNQLDDGTTCPANVTCRIARYDPLGSGNQVGTIGPGEFQWDALGALTELDSHRNDRFERYIYDANEERIVVVAKNAGGAETERRFTIRGVDNKVTRELTFIPSTNTWTEPKDYVYRGGTLIASFSNTSAAPDRHYHSDHLGSTRLMTDAIGQRLAVHAYWAFGQEAQGSDSDGEKMKFTGHERDGSFATGGLELDYMHARYYNPNLGRFLSVDPILGDPAAPQSWNRYAYARNSPLVFTDPTGEFVDLSALTTEERATLIAGLNAFTGNTYDVDPSTNHLMLVSTGQNSSATATAYLDGLIGSTNAYDVVATTKPGQSWYNAAQNRIELDFNAFNGADYNGIDPRTFNIGSTAIHEWTHQTSGLFDTPDGQMMTLPPADYSWTGPVVDAVNVMRAERGLPTRAAYNTEWVRPAGFAGFFGIGPSRSAMRFFDPHRGRIVKVVRNVP